MKIQYWGTGAAEGVPGIFCNCENCRAARLTGGKNIRTRSQILINDDMLIDFGPDTYMHSIMYDFDLSRLAHVLITHPHTDHFYPDEFTNRLAKYAKSVDTDTLVIHGAKETLEAILAVSNDDKRYEGQSRIVFDIMKPYETRKISNYFVTPLPARHTTKTPFVYLIEEDGISFLLLHDTGRPTPEVYDYLKQRGIVLSAISFDTTYGCANTVEKFGKVGHHMGLIDNFAVREFLVMKGIANKQTVCIADHISHQGTDIDYDVISERAEVYGFRVSYDGMTLTLGEEEGE